MNKRRGFNSNTRLATMTNTSETNFSTLPKVHLPLKDQEVQTKMFLAFSDDLNFIKVL